MLSVRNAARSNLKRRLLALPFAALWPADSLSAAALCVPAMGKFAREQEKSAVDQTIRRKALLRKTLPRWLLGL
jgi:hypothetical protein